MDASASVALPVRLDLSNASALADELRACLGADLALDASAVTHLGTPGLQVLLAARKSWDAAGHSLSLINAGDTLAEQLSQFGLTPADLSTGTGVALDHASQAAQQDAPSHSPDPDAPAAPREGAPGAAPNALASEGDTTEEDRP